MNDYVMVFIENQTTHEFLASSDYAGRLAPPVVVVSLGKEFEARAMALIQNGVSAPLECPVNLGYSEELKAHMLLCGTQGPCPDGAADTNPLKLQWVRAATLLNQNLELPKQVTTYLEHAARAEMAPACR